MSPIDRKVYPAGPTWILIIEHRDPSLVTTLSSDADDRTHWLRQVFTTDGQENRNTLPMGPVMTSKSKWDWKVLVIVGSVNETTESATTRWALSADQRILTISTQGAGPKGPTRGKIVYTRQ
jgi:hypothetical protein